MNIYSDTIDKLIFANEQYENLLTNMFVYVLLFQNQ